jgi:hypothetical protein
MPLSHNPILRAEGLDFKDGYGSSLPFLAWNGDTLKERVNAFWDGDWTLDKSMFVND